MRRGLAALVAAVTIGLASSQVTSSPTRSTFGPTDSPTDVVTDAPTRPPTTRPTPLPTETPTALPTGVPTSPTASPTARPSGSPTAPTAAPTASPTETPSSAAPTPSDAPTPATHVLVAPASFRLRLVRGSYSQSCDIGIFGDVCDPLGRISGAGIQSQETNPDNNDNTPIWDHSFHTYCSDTASINFRLQILDDDGSSTDDMQDTQVSLAGFTVSARGDVVTRAAITGSTTITAGCSSGSCSTELQWAWFTCNSTTFGVCGAGVLNRGLDCTPCPPRLPGCTGACGFGINTISCPTLQPTATPVIGQAAPTNAPTTAVANHPCVIGTHNCNLTTTTCVLATLTGFLCVCRVGFAPPPPNVPDNSCVAMTPAPVLGSTFSPQSPTSVAPSAVLTRAPADPTSTVAPTAFLLTTRAPVSQTPAPGGGGTFNPTFPPTSLSPTVVDHPCVVGTHNCDIFTTRCVAVSASGFRCECLPGLVPRPGSSTSCTNAQPTSTQSPASTLAPNPHPTTSPTPLPTALPTSLPTTSAPTAPTTGAPQSAAPAGATATPVAATAGPVTQPPSRAPNPSPLPQPAPSTPPGAPTPGGGVPTAAGGVTQSPVAAEAASGGGGGGGSFIIIAVAAVAALLLALLLYCWRRRRGRSEKVATGGSRKRSITEAPQMHRFTMNNPSYEPPTDPPTQPPHARAQFTGDGKHETFRRVAPGLGSGTAVGHRQANGAPPGGYAKFADEDKAPHPYDEPTSDAVPVAYDEPTADGMPAKGGPTYETPVPGLEFTSDAYEEAVTINPLYAGSVPAKSPTALPQGGTGPSHAALLDSQNYVAAPAGLGAPVYSEAAPTAGGGVATTPPLYAMAAPTTVARSASGGVYNTSTPIGDGVYNEATPIGATVAVRCGFMNPKHGQCKGQASAGARFCPRHRCPHCGGSKASKDATCVDCAAFGDARDLSV
eukprot:m.148283 g.148283  ORF g.148283 m.148283 type:complete len:944 (+) comp14206_c0_seq1:2081-4912(+)